MAEALRVRDRIDVRPRFTEGDAIHLNNMFRGRDAHEMLRVVLRERMAGEVAVVSSFGAESAALLHLLAGIDRHLPVLFLDTHKHFPETIAYRDVLLDRLGMTNLILVEPDPAEVAASDDTGLRWSWDPDGCCELRKVRPLARALAPFDASITGRKGFQAATRAGLPRFEVDNADPQGRLKINPLANWSREEIEGYLERHDLPRHPLVAEGYPSIGCSPCTSKVLPGEDARSGRWKGWDKTECGIHSPTGGLPPGFDPVF